MMETWKYMTLEEYSQRIDGISSRGGKNSEENTEK